MSTALWEKILKYDFDYPRSEYGFSVRLAIENYWTKSFTELAILEYKKFMYLATVSDTMVSPSEVIDVVWHQHLIFSQSYNDFAVVIGKHVQHVPSTGNKDEHNRFRQARVKTKHLYKEAFGDQPKSIWGYKTMLDSLHLDKAKYNIRTVLIFAILAFLVLTVPFYFLLRPMYIRFDNPYFIISYIIACAICIATLELVNRRRIYEMVSEFSVQSFVYNLQPLELIYMQSRKPTDIVHVVVNELISQHKVKVHNDDTLEASGNDDGTSAEGLKTLEQLRNCGRCHYPLLVSHILYQPFVSTIVGSMDAFKKYVYKSKKFGKLLYLNVIWLSALLMFGFSRLMTGILRDKPVSGLTVVLVIVGLITILYLRRLTEMMFTVTIPELYKKEVLPAINIAGSFQWAYFLLGTAVLAGPFSPLVAYVDRHNSGTNNGSGCGSSCGSSCGGSGCGGCGGGD